MGCEGAWLIFWLHHLPSERQYLEGVMGRDLWACILDTLLSFLSLSFLICEMGPMVVEGMWSWEEDTLT